MAARMSIDAEGSNSLMLAIVASSNAPLLLLDGDLSVIAASASFCAAFEIDPGSIPGGPLSGLGKGEWDTPQLGSLLEATRSGYAEIEAYEMDLERPGRAGRRLVLHARKLDYADVDNIRLLLTVADVTDARLDEKLKDNMLRENAILLQELQHRVANSLQIIASVLMQSARSVNSEETRGHLRDAHNRVMSVAAVQQQLTVSTHGEVELRTYLSELCRSISASMIGDRDRLSLEVSADDSVASSTVSVSLGLIVTELVINALKHAFPDGRSGKIAVDYRVLEDGWRLSVKDDGVGLPSEPDSVHLGLGTSIVESLARQLGARVEVDEAAPGHSVSIICD